VAVVTGAGRGLGRNIALGLAARGARVAGLARSPEQLEESSRLCREAGGEMVVFAGDVADIDEIERLAGEIREQLGSPAVLVNAAGVFGPIGLIHETDPREWVRTVMIDGIAPYLVVRAFLAEMLDAGWGRIVNVTSAASLHPPGPLNSAYATAKVALNQFTRHLAAEIAGSGVTANVIHPGDVKTDMWADIRHKVSQMGPEADAYRQWVEWVEETGGDPPEKAVKLVLDIMGPDYDQVNGRFLWVDNPLQAPIPSWEEPVAAQPWRK
jgi:NAD(P)-dependent dehydrogenase (short-subunit alcohol dehydrogenase family)